MKGLPKAKPDPSFASTRLTRTNYHGPPLLSQVGGVKTRQRDAKSEPQKPKPEPATDDEPISSDDESSENAVGDEEKGDHSDGGREVRTSSIPTKQESASTKLSKRTSPPKRNSSASLEHSDDDDDPFSFMSQSSQNHKRRRNTYGGSVTRNIHAASTSARPSSSRPHNKKTDSTQSLGSTGFQLPREVPVPDKSPIRPKKSPEEIAKGFQVPQDIHIPSPRKERDAGPAFQMPTGGELEDPIHSSQAGNGFREPPDLPSSSLTTKESGFTEVSTPLSLSSVASDLFPKDFELAELDESSSELEEALCPVCHAVVEWSMLEMFRSQKRQGPREKRVFCRQHKRRDAEKEWERRGYPTIDWDGFEERIRRHLPAIEKLAIKGGPSYYRDILDAKIRDGKVNWRLTMTGDDLDNMACGYYGSKGATKM